MAASTKTKTRKRNLTGRPLIFCLSFVVVFIWARSRRQVFCLGKLALNAVYDNAIKNAKKNSRTLSVVFVVFNNGSTCSAVP